MKFRVTYRGFLQVITRDFESYEIAVTWCRQIGKAYLIPKIQEIARGDSQ